jgi:hypothetical protein
MEPSLQSSEKKARLPKRYIAGWVVTIVAALVGGLVTPWVAESLRPKPDVYFVKDRCAIVPTGTNTTLIKLVVKNKGQAQETSVQLYVRLTSPYVLHDTTQNYYTADFPTLSAGESYMSVTSVVNPTVQFDQHNSITVTAEIIGTKVWDTYEISESW